MFVFMVYENYEGLHNRVFSSAEKAQEYINQQPEYTRVECEVVQVAVE